MASTPVKSDEPDTSVEVAREVNRDVYSIDDLHDINSLQDALDLVGDVDDFSEYGTGFVVLDKRDKDRLVGVPFVIVEWRFNHSAQYQGDFVSALVVTESGEKYVINDGSTGICTQLKSVLERRIKNNRARPNTGLTVRGGLRRSDYDTTDGDGNPIKATTYYLS